MRRTRQTNATTTIQLRQQQSMRTTIALTLVLLLQNVSAVTMSSPVGATHAMTTPAPSLPPSMPPVEMTAYATIRLNGIDKKMNDMKVLDVFEEVTAEYLSTELNGTEEESSMVKVVAQLVTKNDDDFKKLSHAPSPAPTDEVIVTNPGGGGGEVSSSEPTHVPTSTPSTEPSGTPSVHPTSTPSTTPSVTPSVTPSSTPTTTPSSTPSAFPTAEPTTTPSSSPSSSPSATPSTSPSATPSSTPSASPTSQPTSTPTQMPSATPSEVHSDVPSSAPTAYNRDVLTASPTVYYPKDIFFDRDRRMKKDDDTKGLLIRFAYTTQASPQLYPNVSALTTAVYDAFGPDGNVDVYHYKLYESHGFFKDIEPTPVAPTDDDDEIGKIVNGGSLGGGGGSSSSSPSVPVGFIYAMAAICVVCALVAAHVKYRNYRENQMMMTVGSNLDDINVHSGTYADEEDGAGTTSGVEMTYAEKVRRNQLDVTCHDNHHLDSNQYPPQGAHDDDDPTVLGGECEEGFFMGDVSGTNRARAFMNEKQSVEVEFLEP